MTAQASSPSPLPGIPAAAVRATLRIRGRVQGVAYRASARAEAQRLGLAGWVRNLPDGAVALVVEGPEALVERLIAWCRVGPPGARVESVEADRGVASGEFHGFAIAR